MRRLIVWTVLAAIVGLALAAGGYWAYWSMYARFQPVTITENQAEIQRLLDASPYLSAERGGTPVWIVGYRDSAAFQTYLGAEADLLRAGGVEPRVIVFARPDRDGVTQSTGAERATVAELWLSRDWSLFQRWMATPPDRWTAPGLPSADNLTRRAVVEGGRDLADRLTTLLAPSGIRARWPLVLWRDPQGFLKACACVERGSWKFVRDDLDASEPGVENPETPPLSAAPVSPPAPAAPPVAADDGPGAMPYPQLEEILPAPQPRYAPAAPDVAPAPAPQTPAVPAPAPRPQPTSPAARPVPPATTRPAPSTTSRRPPEARRDEETTFF